MSEKRAEEFCRRFPGCGCEGVSISPHSPGRVEVDEVLARFVFEPKHIGPDGLLEVGALHDVTRNGLSTQRRRTDDAARLQQTGLSIAEAQNERAMARAAIASKTAPPSLTFRGIVELPVSGIRGHSIEGQRSFCVMDSADENDPLHADVIVNGQRSKAQRLKLYNDLRNLVVRLMPRDP